MLSVEMKFAKAYLISQRGNEAAIKPLTPTERRDLKRLRHEQGPLSNTIRWAAKRHIADLRRQRALADPERLRKRDYWRAYWDNQRRRFR